MKLAVLLLYAVLSFSGLTVRTAPQQQKKVLSINPVYQQSPVWCWLTVGEMVFRYYGICTINPAGDYQCGIISLVSPVCDRNCYDCQLPAASMAVISEMLLEYPKAANKVCGYGRNTINSTLRKKRISSDDVKDEINNNRPVIAGISPQGDFGSTEPSHVALIIGYYDFDSKLVLVVNDPFPYEAFPYVQDPYMAARGEFVVSGQYVITYTDFLKLNWSSTIEDIE